MIKNNANGLNGKDAGDNNVSNCNSNNNNTFLYSKTTVLIGEDEDDS